MTEEIRYGVGNEECYRSALFDKIRADIGTEDKICASVYEYIISITTQRRWPGQKTIFTEPELECRAFASIHETRSRRCAKFYKFSPSYEVETLSANDCVHTVTSRQHDFTTRARLMGHHLNYTGRVQ